MIKTSKSNEFKLNLIGKISQYFLHKSLKTSLPSHTAYNLTISKEKKFIWFRVSKVGTRTFYNILKKQPFELIAEHPYRVVYSPKKYNDYFKFAFVRNPYDRLVSCWKNKVLESNYFNLKEKERQELKEFSKFVEYVSKFDLNSLETNGHIRLQRSLIDLNHIDFLGRFENFNEDLKIVLNKLEIDISEIEHKNKSLNQKHYSEYYSDDLRDKVYKLYERDFRIFNYPKDL